MIKIETFDSREILEKLCYAKKVIKDMPDIMALRFLISEINELVPIEEDKVYASSEEVGASIFHGSDAIHAIYLDELDGVYEATQEQIDYED